MNKYTNTIKFLFLSFGICFIPLQAKFTRECGRKLYYMVVPVKEDFNVALDENDLNLESTLNIVGSFQKNIVSHLSICAQEHNQ
jgi:hypothetical protein